MSAAGVHSWADTWADVRRSFGDFLVVPAVTILVCVLLALVSFALDGAEGGAVASAKDFLSARLFTSEGAIDSLLSTLAGGMITLTSITFSMLLLAVQQSAGSLTTQVLDQFMRRRLNQFYFGAFVGVSLHILIVMATVGAEPTPVFSALMALLLTCVSLVLLIFLQYTTVNQMRANRIVEAIHDLTLDSRERQQPLLARTRREPQLMTAAVTHRVLSNNNGYMANLHLDRIAKVTGGRDDSEVHLFVSIGDYVCYRDVIAEIRTSSLSVATEIGHAVLHAVDLERQRNMQLDPGYGVTQLGTIGWTATSTANSNPSPALACLRNLRDLVARWSMEESAEPCDDRVPVVYRDDLLRSVIDAFESVGVAAAESMQHQCCAEVLCAFSSTFAQLPATLQRRTEDAVRRTLSSLGDHVLTADIDSALLQLAKVLESAGRVGTASEIRTAHLRLSTTVGQLHSRSTRVSRE